MLEIALLVVAVIVLVRGKLQITRRRVVVGTTARLIALIGLVPLPASFAVGFGIGVYQGVTHSLSAGAVRGVATAVEVSLTLVCFAAMILLGLALGGPPEPSEGRIDRHGPDRLDIDR